VLRLVGHVVPGEGFDPHVLKPTYSCQFLPHAHRHGHELVTAFLKLSCHYGMLVDAPAFRRRNPRS
jgi:hypothetical protein